MNFLNRSYIFLINQKGIKKNLLTFCLGTLVTLAMPPVYLWPLAIVGFSGFFILINQCTDLKNAFKTGWWFGFGHFVTGLYWIAFALLIDVGSFGWLIPFAVFGIPAVIAIYTGIVACITSLASRRLKSYSLVIFFSCIWTIVELLRGWLFTGFPWNLTGYIWTASDNILQFVSFAGIISLSLITVLAFTMPAILIAHNKPSKSRSNYKLWIPTFLPIITLIAIFVWGSQRLSSAAEQFVPGVKVRIVQANIPQNMKWEEEWRYETVRKYLEMSHREGFEDITHIIWPETALPFIVSDNSPILDVISQIVPKNGAIITGALRAEYTDTGTLKNMWNSLITVSDKGKLYSSYDKSHLVPFGEYVPFRNILPLEKITHGSVDFTSGEGIKTIDAPGLPEFGGLVCYEVIFPGKVVDPSHRPKILINVTNDAWYGNTSGPYQHFQMTRTRSIEEGIPLIRAANNGISGVIDAYGRVIKNSQLGSEAILDSYLPISTSATTYSRHGNSIVILMIGILLLISCINCIISND